MEIFICAECLQKCTNHMQSTYKHVNEKSSDKWLITRFTRPFVLFVQLTKTITSIPSIANFVNDIKPNPSTQISLDEIFGRNVYIYRNWIFRYCD